MSMEQLAKEVIRERTASRAALQRPTHPRAAKLLRRIADRMETSV